MRFIPKVLFFSVFVICLFILGNRIIFNKKNLKENIVVENINKSKQEDTKKEDEKVSLPEEKGNIELLFTTDASKLPIVETIIYSNRVPWLKERPAWITDYAAHYHTTKHFIARSLNKKADYFTQNISIGEAFNVLRTDKDISFYLIVDLSKTKMLFYAIDNTDNQTYLLKTYDVGVGKKDLSKTSGCLTPLGKYILGDKVAIYKPGIKGYFKNKKIEMIKEFGTRWIPFEKELENCSELTKGLGIHGTPWIENKKIESLVEERSKVSIYDSNGCLRLLSEDMEELFSVIISRPTVIEIVKSIENSDFFYDINKKENYTCEK